MCAAALTLEHLETRWDEESLATSIGERDALSLVIVTAIRNTYRGGCVVLGDYSEPVQAFIEVISTR
jgi:hypothetical protein